MNSTPHAAQSFDEQLVVFAEGQAGCLKDAHASIPPPESCPSAVQAMYGIAQWHLATILIVFLFLLMMFELTMHAINPGGGGH